MYPFQHKALLSVLILAGVAGLWVVMRQEPMQVAGRIAPVEPVIKAAELQAPSLVTGQLCRPVLTGSAGIESQCRAVTARTVTML